MNKWFDNTGKPQGIIVASKIRLARNIEGYVFPGKLEDEEREQLIQRVKEELKDLNLEYIDLKQLTNDQKQMLREHRVINSNIASRKEPMGLLLSEDESVSVLIGGDDHLRMQCQKAGSFLRRELQTLDQLDDEINEKFDYAYHDHYGYLTAFPTNMGTGMRASTVLHLPLISRERDFKQMGEELGRMGIRMKGVFGDVPSDNYGQLYRLSNQRTLGLTETEILENVERFALQLAEQERRAENDMLKNHKGDMEDEAYKSYGILKYARKLSLKECLIYLSQVRMGMANGVLQTKEPVCIYRLMIQAQPGSLADWAGRSLGEDEVQVVRAKMIQAHLPEIV